ncbi:hypothetical protein ACPROK_09550 [Glutamicibacter soli]|uniref:hypothetical protein n=1 Tax=Glutamicibacter soli TaxID=453836 RepID=UPI003C7767C1
MNKMSNATYSIIISLAGVLFAALALFAYFSGRNALIFVGMGIFFAVTMAMSSLHARQQAAARAEERAS